MVISLSGRVALLTNCCTTMGRAIGRQLGMAGSKLILWDPNTQHLIDYSKELINAGIDKVHAVDRINGLSTHQQRLALLREANKQFGGLDYVIANMGENVIRGDVMDMNASQFDEMMEQYLSVPFRLVQHSIPILEKSSNGCILLLSSMAAFTPFLDCGLYAIAQNAVVAMCKALAISAAKRGVRINCIGTGIVSNDGSAASWDKASPQELDKLCSLIPIARIGQPSDCTGIIKFLLSDQAKYITGENIMVNGGVCVRF